MSTTIDENGPVVVRRSPSPALVDVAIVLVWFLVAGVLGAVAWWLLTDLPEATRSGGAVVVEPDELGKQVNIDGWFFVIAAAGGLVSGVALLFWRWRDPLLMVGLVTLGGGLASYVMVLLGRQLGPASEVEVLRQQADNATALLELKVHATGAFWVWPAAAALGALVYLWVLKDPDTQ